MVETDHHALTFLKSAAHNNGRLARWALQMHRFDFAFLYHRGNSNRNTDALSRAETEEDPDQTFIDPDCGLPIWWWWGGRLEESVGASLPPPDLSLNYRTIYVFLHEPMDLYLLPACASEQGNVIGSVRIYIYIYIYIYMCTKKICN